MATRGTALATDDWTAHADDADIADQSYWQDINVSGNGAVIVETTAGPVAQGRGGAASYDDGAAAVWTGAGSFDNDQWAEITLKTSWQSIAYHSGVIVRASTDTDANRDCYFLAVMHDGNGLLTTTLGLITDGTPSIIYQEASIAWATNDTLSLEVEGTALRGMQNGALINASFDETDATLSTGNPGVWAAGVRTGGDLGALDWEAGNFVGGATTSDVNLHGTGRGISRGVARGIG